MYVVTGADGFIGSNLVDELNRRGVDQIVLVDQYASLFSGDLSAIPPAEARYTSELRCAGWLDFRQLPQWLDRAGDEVRAVIHLGACSDTTVTDRDYVMINNFEYSRQLWSWCTRAVCPLIYASSAATYGDGQRGYSDRLNPAIYRPLNLYGESKQLFDLWALQQLDQPPHWAGVKYFNVYGPQEQHKGRMASVVWHCYRQIQREGRVSLFQSHRPDVRDGGQQRDFLYVRDAVDATLYLLEAPLVRGLYNVGTGKARTFEDLAKAVFSALDREPDIEYIPMPEDLRWRYQYFTQAVIDKLRQAGFASRFHTLEEGVQDYVTQYLANEVVVS